MKGGAVIFITLLSFLSPGSTAGYTKGYTAGQLSEGSASNEPCPKDAIFPQPPCCGISNQLLNRISFGNKTELNEFPWMVLIFNPDDQGFGGATLINSRWVLTAAHNFKGNFANDELHLGEWNRTADPDCVDNFCKPKIKRVKVDKVIIHQLYYAVKHDIALLHLAEDVTFTEYIKPICLPLNGPKKQTLANKMAIASGWGTTEKGEGSDVLLKTSLKVLDSKCSDRETTICATGAGKSTTGAGDSGGPLMLRMQNNGGQGEAYFQIGVLSGGIYSPGSVKKSVYTYVPAHIEWIKSEILKYQKSQES